MAVVQLTDRPFQQLLVHLSTQNIAARAPQLLEVEAAWAQSQAAGPGQEPPPPVNEMEQQLAFMKGLCRPLPGPSWLLGILNRDNVRISIVISC